MDITFVTGNKNKVEEAEKILNIPVKIKDMDLDEIQSLDLTKISLKKAEKAYSVVRSPLFVEDGGLYISALKGFPGPFVKFVLEAGGPELILKMLSKEKERSAEARLAVAFTDGKTTELFQGKIKGKISEKKMGDRFGWDPIFIPEGQNVSFAQMNQIEKNKISHRAIALKKLKKYLKEKNYVYNKHK